ncbi:hypothetical protein PIB30_007204 [Stylosanthes scabra]|uniref:Uncharacterized protein n=1 Tax=Stylosanthes scabra TaxID=79078 RepID=A0ABU6U4W0_9FABA|nr:hypothetical protein [Stylosanthes scabra]
MILKKYLRLWCGSGRVRPSEDFLGELFKVQCARTEEEHFNFHKNLQCSSDLQGTTGVDLLDLAALEVISLGFGPVEVDHLYKSSVIGLMSCLTDCWFSKSSLDELFWAELMTGRITAVKLDLIGIGRLSF